MQYKDTTLLLSASDLVDFLGCKHLTSLNKGVAAGIRGKPDYYDPALALLQQKGRKHEQAYTAHLKAQGKTVFEVPERTMEATLAAMAEGYDVITQAAFYHKNWRGRTDYLVKREGNSKLGDYHYEIEDTKLSQETKAGTILQLCLYTDLLGHYQGRKPEYMYIVKPGREFRREAYRFADFEAYYRLVKRKFLEFLSGEPEDTYPLPVEKCHTCDWWKECKDRRHRDDHLSLIAGSRTMHVKELTHQGIHSLTQYALEERPLPRDPERGNRETYKRLHSQARIQAAGRKAGKMLYKLLTIEEGRGINRLPEPGNGDIYFDIEGDHFYEEGGMEYLFGFATKGPGGQYRYTKYWARNRKEEKDAFQKFMQFVLRQWEKYPGFYIYHYAPYEPSAIKRLASRHAVMENEVDKLLRAERFIDLYTVVRECLQASVEAYSLKDVEKLTAFVRQADLRLAGRARRRFATALQLKTLDTFPEQDCHIIERYNTDDCLATRALHELLESIYQAQRSDGAAVRRPEIKSGEATDAASERQQEAEQLYKALTKGLDPDRKDNWSAQQQGVWLLAHQLEYFRREEKNAWWEFFRLNEADPLELFDERKAISGLEPEGEVKEEKKIKTHRYRFPAQEISLEPGAELYEVKGKKVGKIAAIDTLEGWVEIKKMKKTNDVHPVAVHCNEMISAKPLADALKRFSKAVISHGIDGDGPFRAGRDLLLKKPPRLLNGETPLVKKGETMEQAALRVLRNLDTGILPVQGPPGTGKTYTGGRLIAELVKKGKKVGVTAVSHKVIRNLLDTAVERGLEEGVTVAIRHRHTGGDPDDPVNIPREADIRQLLRNGAVVGGTCWLWAKDAYTGELDYLFVDEAGQMSLANVLSVCRSARNIVLLGDPQQLEQPQQGAHPEGADVSALEHLLDGKQTIPREKGLFLDTTWRLAPEIAAFTSQVYYEGRLKAKETLALQEIKGNSPFAGQGLFYVPVEHSGNQNKSPEEVRQVSALVDHLTSAGLTWTDREGKVHLLEGRDILIVSPYNAQVNALKGVLPGVSVGTVDKFQGQEAPVVIYSMTSSSPEDAPRGMGFLYSPSRLNVATSRARCICLLVASPALSEPECHTIQQMKWANGLCKYLEMAKVVRLP